MNSRAALLFLLAVILGEGVLLLYSQRRHSEKRTAERSESRKLGEPLPKWEAAVEASAKKIVSREADLPTLEPLPPREADKGTSQPIQAAQQVLRAGVPMDQALAALERKLLALPPQISIQQIRTFLGTGEDFPTGLRLVVGEERLASAPTLRVALLDLLGRLCRTSGTREAADVGRELLLTLDSADEFALSLRNVAWVEPEASGYLGNRLDALLEHKPWQKEPTGGFAAALDVAAFLGDSKRLVPLEQCAHSESSELRQAAESAMERLCERSPLDSLRLLNRKPTLLAALPKLRAVLFARADFSHSVQRSLVETYLTRRDVSHSEKETFLEELQRKPADSGPYLVCRPLEKVAENVRSQRLSDLVADWISSDRFRPLKPNLEAFRARLMSSMAAFGGPD